MRVIGTPFATSTGLELLETDLANPSSPTHSGHASSPSSPTQTPTLPLPRPQAHRQPQSVDRHPLRPQNRHRLGEPPPGDGLRLRHDLLEKAPRLAPGRGLGEAPPDTPGRAERGGQDRLLRAPVDSRSSAPPAVARRRAPARSTAAREGASPNLIDAGWIPPLADRRPPTSPTSIRWSRWWMRSHRCAASRAPTSPPAAFADRAYDSQPHRRRSRLRGIRPYIPC